MVEKLRRILVLGASPFFFLFLLSLLYLGEFGSQVVPSNQAKKQRANWGGSRIEDQENLHFLMEKLVQGGNQTDQQEATGFACHSDLHTDVCVSNRPVRIDTLTMKVYALFSQGMSQANRIIHPYPKKEEKWVKRSVSPVQILQGNISPPPPCRYTHNVPAVVFSSGGYSGNVFHDFSELIIPLFLTSHHFQSRLHFIVTDFKPIFFDKYRNIFSHLSSYEVINPAANVGVHCFPGLVVGLHYHDHLAINTTAIPRGYSILDFKQFLRESYNLKIRDLSPTEKPVLILISRPKSRMFLNEDQMVTMMKELDFRVVIAKPDMMANIGKFSKIVNSCSVLVAAHGAGLTNIIFLPQGAVMVQVVGLDLEWASTHYYGKPATEMGLNYLEYKIEPEESSLISHYGRDNPIITDPASIVASRGMLVGRAIYLGEQNFNINVTRFRNTVVKALELIGHLAG
ncbi:hypothetical protein RHGRI_018685 [Rhododendron griersonianum]|uniref:Glycosyltransferase 61 catalytic domain-containing protein n=1 Tax=Rhododendron griersonianum TaxID=479676 RepID=A0AAV6K2J0_9ERIC|nr:hypothetical protein RHGRI_018685 [Rhododendron griersonianum]